MLPRIPASAKTQQDDPLERLRHAATVLREHRGDGHVAALVAGGLSGAESVAWRAVTDGTWEVLQRARGWTDAEWADALTALRDRRWLGPTGEPTELGRTAYLAVEANPVGLTEP